MPEIGLGDRRASRPASNQKLFWPDGIKNFLFDLKAVNAAVDQYNDAAIGIGGFTVLQY